jgi:hypothetical protein
MSLLARITVWVVLGVLVALVNAPTVEYGFVYDDNAYILERAPAWEQGWGEFFSERSFGVGRHFALLSLDLDRRDPLKAQPFHITNIAIAILATILLWELAVALGLSLGGALGAAALFAVHPVHPDAIVSITGRAGSLAAVSVMGCLLMHARGYGRGIAGYGAAGLLFLLGLASKEDALVLIPVLILYDLIVRPSTQNDATPWRAYVAYAGVAIAWFAGIYSNLATVDAVGYFDNPLAHVNAWQRITRAAELLWSYAAITVWPTDLLPDRAFATTRPETVAGPLGLIAWILAIAAAFALRRRSPAAAFAFLWFPATFAVTANVVFPIGTIMAERLAYLPSAGFCLLAGVAIAGIARRGRIAGSLTAVVAFVAVFAMGLAYDDRARVWASDDHYHWVATIMSPDSTKAHHNLGLLRARAGDYELAAQSFERSLKLYPAFSRSALYLADVYGRMDRPLDAARTWERYVLEQPEDAGARSQILRLYLWMEDFESALPHARAMVELEPGEIEHVKSLVLIESRARGENIVF